MDLPPEQSNVNCSYCKKSVPAANIDLHSAHCFRIMERCRLDNEFSPGAEQARRNVNRHRDASGRSQTSESPRKGFFSTVAVAGVIVLLGSVFFKREGQNQHLR